jgi:argininosuccinate lyase
VRHLEFDRDRLAAAAADPLLLATDAADELVRAGTPFRKAHEEIGRQVREGALAPPWEARASVAKRRLGVARRATALRKEAAALKR